MGVNNVTPLSRSYHLAVTLGRWRRGFARVSPLCRTACYPHLLHRARVPKRSAGGAIVAPSRPTIEAFVRWMHNDGEASQRVSCTATAPPGADSDVVPRAGLRCPPHHVGPTYPMRSNRSR